MLCASLLISNYHPTEQFIKPAELKAALTRHGLEPQEMRGMTPEKNPLILLLALRRYKRGVLSFRQLCELARFKAGGNRWASYLGYALKQA